MLCFISTIYLLLKIFINNSIELYQYGLNFIKTNLPQSKVMLYSEQNDQKTIEITLQGKADGHMIKGSRIEEIVYAIKKVTRGDHYFSSVFHKHKFSSKL